MQLPSRQGDAGSDPDSVASLRIRLKYVRWELARWQAFEADRGPRPNALNRASLEQLQAHLVQTIAERESVD